MEKRYYFRGLGLGIIVTALIMGIALSRGAKREMTDAEVIARAKKLGMTENTRLLESPETVEDQEAKEPSAEKETEKEPVKKDVAVAQSKDDAAETSKAVGESLPKADEEEPLNEEGPAGGGESEASEKPTTQASSTQSTQNKKPPADTNEMTKQDEEKGQDASSEEESSQQTAAAASVTIVSGDGSYTVAKKLEDAGVIFSASAYDNYLCQHGYDKRLRTGTFQIPAGASDEQIAKIVTSQP